MIVYNFSYRIIYIRALILILLPIVAASCQLSNGEGLHKLPGDSPFTFLKNDSIISICQVENYCDVRKEFSLSSQTKVRVSSCGEIIKGKDNGKRDVFEMYFDVLNKKSKKYDSKIDRFFFFSEKGGSSDRVTAIFSNISKNSYVIELAYPRDLLGIDLTNGKIVGFDFAFSDNDNGFKQEKQIAWHANDSDIWLDPSLWGNLQLVLSADGKKDESTVLSVHSQKSPILDGKEELCWSKAPSFEAKRVLYGIVENSAGNSDIVVKLKSLWDEKNVYFLVEVQDDKIVRQSYMSKAFDYGWIETSTGRKVWEMDAQNSRYAGGAAKNFCSDTVLQLPAGNYILGYHSDESHAYDQWDDDPPSASFYGIELKFFREE